MAVNIEIKARVQDFATLEANVEALSDTTLQVLSQEDTFFHSPQGRLKLREEVAGQGQLVYYDRPDTSGPKRSDYLVVGTDNPHVLKTILTAVLGRKGVVRKKRHLFFIGQTRVHLDDVESLGHFIELEVVMRSDQPDCEGFAIANNLMEKLGISNEDLIECAYIDIIEQRNNE